VDPISLSTKLRIWYTTHYQYVIQISFIAQVNSKHLFCCCYLKGTPLAVNKATATD